MVGVILSANRWTRLVANGPAGVLVDRIGTRKPFVAGLAIEGLATFGYVIAIRSAMPELWFVIARVTWGIGSSLVFATAYTITADVSEASSRGTSMGIVRAGITFGFPAGMVLGGIVSEVYSNVAAFVLAASFAGLARLLSPTSSSPRRTSSRSTRRSAPGTSDDPARAHRRPGQLRALLRVHRRPLLDARPVPRGRIAHALTRVRGLRHRLRRTGNVRTADGCLRPLGSGLHHLGREDQRRRRCSHARPARLPRDQLCRVRRAHGRTLVQGPSSSPAG